MRAVSLSAAPYDGYAFPEMLDSMARCGVRSVEPAFIVGYTEPFDEATFAPASARRHRAWLDASGLRCHAMSSHIDLGRDDARDVFRGRMDFAAALGAKVIATNAAHRARRARFLANIVPLADHAAALGLVIGLENPGNGEDNLMNDAAEGLALIAELGLPAVRLNYDPGNTASHRPGRIAAAADAVAALPGCAHFHLKDVRHDSDGWRFTVPGRGEIGCDPIMDALAGRPDLSFAVELPLRMRRDPDAQPLRRPDPVPLAEVEAAVRECLAYVRRWVPERERVPDDMVEPHLTLAEQAAQLWRDIRQLEALAHHGGGNPKPGRHRFDGRTLVLDQGAERLELVVGMHGGAHGVFREGDFGGIVAFTQHEASDGRVLGQLARCGQQLRGAEPSGPGHHFECAVFVRHGIEILAQAMSGHRAAWPL